MRLNRCRKLSPGWYSRPMHWSHICRWQSQKTMYLADIRTYYEYIALPSFRTYFKYNIKFACIYLVSPTLNKIVRLSTFRGQTLCPGIFRTLQKHMWIANLIIFRVHYGRATTGETESKDVLRNSTLWTLFVFRRHLSEEDESFFQREFATANTK